MKNVKPYASQIATGVVVLILCLAAFLAWNEFWRDDAVYESKYAAEINRLTAKLDSSAVAKAAEFENYKDSIEAHYASADSLLADTTGFTTITAHHDEIRTARAAMDASEHVELAKYRLRNWPIIKQRYDYSLMSD